jgi:hypothetical protein
MAEKKKARKIRIVSKTPISQEPLPEISNDEIALRAYFLWEGRGKPIGSPEEDWFRATEELRASTVDSLAT